MALQDEIEDRFATAVKMALETARTRRESAAVDAAQEQAAGGAHCPSAEEIAAYYEYSLSRVERARCESHFSDCPRCQGTLAALLHAAPMGDVIAEPTGHEPAQAGRERTVSDKRGWLRVGLRIVGPTIALAALLAVVIVAALHIRHDNQAREADDSAASRAAPAGQAASANGGGSGASTPARASAPTSETDLALNQVPPMPPAPGAAGPPSSQTGQAVAPVNTGMSMEALRAGAPAPIASAAAAKPVEAAPTKPAVKTPPPSATEPAPSVAGAQREGKAETAKLRPAASSPAPAPSEAPHPAEKPVPEVAAVSGATHVAGSPIAKSPARESGYTARKPVQAMPSVGEKEHRAAAPTSQVASEFEAKPSVETAAHPKGRAPMVEARVSRKTIEANPSVTEVSPPKETRTSKHAESKPRNGPGHAAGAGTAEISGGQTQAPASGKMTARPSPARAPTERVESLPAAGVAAAPPARSSAGDQPEAARPAAKAAASTSPSHETIALAPAIAPIMPGTPLPPARSVLVTPPDHSVYWALEDFGVIFRSTNHQNWAKQASGVETDLLAGSAPSDRVCWAVGRKGTVLLTTDGEHWERVKSPTAADLVAVTALSAYVATIAASDGSRFSTFDGGSNWQAVEQ